MVNAFLRITYIEFEEIMRKFYYFKYAVLDFLAGLGLFFLVECYDHRRFLVVLRYGI